MTSLAGKFLVARPSLRDPNFHQTVILLLQHGPDGAFGLVVNRTAKMKGFPFPVYGGGPCGSEGLLMLHGHADWNEPTPEAPGAGVAPGIFLGDSSCLARVNNEPKGLRFRMFSGYSGWGPDQLEGEMAAGVWVVTPATGELLFGTPVDKLWEHLSPPSIPQPSLN